MQVNNESIAGVLHHKHSEAHYRLRRYFPDQVFSGFIEQFWLVDWHLSNENEHTQQNLPDPNFHLVISERDVKLLGPVSKTYSYSMKGQGRIIGIKFEIGGLINLLTEPMTEYIDKELKAADIFGSAVQDVLLPLYKEGCDSKVINALQEYFKVFVSGCSKQQIATQKLVSIIKNNQDIYKVEQLSVLTNISSRAIQRYFLRYVGLPPKWLIRKYRLSHVLKELESSSVNVLDIVTKLEYADQSHLIKDFNDFLGVTPGKYIKAPHSRFMTKALPER